MYAPTEVITFMAGIVVLLFIYQSKEHLKKVPSSKILIRAYYLLVLSWSLAIAEEAFLNYVLNLGKNFLTATSYVLIASWFWKVWGR